MIEDEAAGLRALVARLISAQDRDAERLASQLHDGLGQTLTALKLDLAWISARAEGDAAVAAKLHHMTALVDDLFAAIRRMAAEVHPRLLADLGLVAGLEDLVRDFACDGDGDRGACTIDLHAGDLVVPPIAALTLYRVAHECLDNVRRHAGACRVEMSLTRDGDHAVLAIRDDGRGVTGEQLVLPTSIGIAAMRERMRVVGGSLVIRGDDSGTMVIARVPI